MWKLPYLPNIQFSTDPELHDANWTGAVGTVRRVNHVVDADVATIGWQTVGGVTDHNSILVGWQDNTQYRFAPLDQRRSQLSAATCIHVPAHGEIPPFFVPPLHPRMGRTGGRRWTVELEKITGAGDPAEILLAHVGVRPWPETHILGDRKVWEECTWIPWRTEVSLSFGVGATTTSDIIETSDPVLITGGGSEPSFVPVADLRVEVKASSDGELGPMTGRSAVHPQIIAPSQFGSPLRQWMGGYWVEGTQVLYINASRTQNLGATQDVEFCLYGWTRGDLT